MATDHEREDFARKLKRLTAKRGWNQSELSRRSGIGRDVISGYVRGKHLPDLANQGRLAQALGVPIEDLFPEMAPLEAPERSGLEFKAFDDGTALLRVNRRVPLAIALEVLKLLSDEKR